MTDQVQIRVNGKPVSIPDGTAVAAAIIQAGINHFHRSPSSQPRGPLCGMGVCMECRVTIDGRKHARSCTTLCTDGMEVWTDE